MSSHLVSLAFHVWCGYIWIMVTILCLLRAAPNKGPAVSALMWTAPWLMLVTLHSLELSGTLEQDLLVLSTVFIVMFYTSVRALKLFFLFEAAGLPLLLGIFLVGRQPQKVEAGKYILFYIAFTAFPLLCVVSTGCLSVDQIFSVLGFVSLVPFLAKIPAYLLHAWLPKAHVEASTPGSIVLAGSVIKLGSFGMLN